MKYLLALAAAVVATPVLAQPSAPVPAASAASPAAPAPSAIDPQRLALARTAIGYIWPLGTYRRMMNGTFDQLTDTMIQSMLDVKMQDVVPLAGAGGKPVDPKLAHATFREMIAKVDPHFAERMRITNHVMMSEMVPILTKFEPDIREAFARAYARKFTADQLSDMNQFFATPTGRVFASEAMLTMVDPDVIKTMSKFTPELMRAMPQIMEKVKEATAHLPPPAIAHQATSATNNVH